MLAYFQPLTLAALRVFVAFMFWQYAAQKLFGMHGAERAEILSLFWFVGLVELIGSIALAIGFLTRPVAIVLSVNMVLVYVVQYLPRGFPPVGGNLGEQAVTLFIVSGLLVFAGPGRFSVDTELERERPDLRLRWSAGWLQKYNPHALGAFRILMGLLFMLHGLPKLGIGGQAAELLTERWIGGVVEAVGGAAIALGVFTRPVAFVAAGQMAFAYFLSHAPRAFFPIENSGDRAASFCFFFLFLVTAGSGVWAVDAWLGRRARD